MQSATLSKHTQFPTEECHPKRTMQSCHGGHELPHGTAANFYLTEMQTMNTKKDVHKLISCPSETQNDVTSELCPRGLPGFECILGKHPMSAA